MNFEAIRYVYKLVRMLFIHKKGIRRLFSLVTCVTMDGSVYISVEGTCEQKEKQ